MPDHIHLLIKIKDVEKRKSLPVLVWQLCRALSAEHSRIADGYGKNAVVERSLIADGCVIEGKVINSVLFRGVHVGADCVVENAVISERCALSGHACVSGAILDKNVILGGNVRLSGHPSLPFFVEEGRVIN